MNNGSEKPCRGEWVNCRAKETTVPLDISIILSSTLRLILIGGSQVADCQHQQFYAPQHYPKLQAAKKSNQLLQFLRTKLAGYNFLHKLKKQYNIHNAIIKFQVRMLEVKNYTTPSMHINNNL